MLEHGPGYHKDHSYPTSMDFLKKIYEIESLVKKRKDLNFQEFDEKSLFRKKAAV